MSLSAREFIEQKIGGHTLSSISRESGLSYAVLHSHVHRSREMSPKNAERLAAWTKRAFEDEPEKQISAAKTLGLTS